MLCRENSRLTEVSLTAILLSIGSSNTFSLDNVGLHYLPTQNQTPWQYITYNLSKSQNPVAYNLSRSLIRFPVSYIAGIICILNSLRIHSRIQPTVPYTYIVNESRKFRPWKFRPRKFRPWKFRPQKKPRKLAPKNTPKPLKTLLHR